MTFINETGYTSAGYFRDSTPTWWPPLGQPRGTLVTTADGGVQINWANGTSWKKV